MPPPAKSPLSQRVYRTLSDLGRADRGSRLVVAVSGGPDSLALLHALVGAAPAAGLSLQAAHLHHGLRGDSADRDVDLVRGLCQDWDVPLVVERVEVPVYANAHHLSLEEAAREARYAFLGAVARQVHGDAVLTAHTADDLVESVLLHLLRGSGIGGLAGMRPVSWLEARPGVRRAGAELFPAEAEASRLPMALIRPLLAVWRVELESHCRAHGLEARHDPSNYDLRYTRNRVRHELVPVLQAFNPRVKEAIARLSRLAADDLDLVAGEALKLWPDDGSDDHAQARFSLSTWRAAPPALRRALLRLGYQRCRGEGADLQFVHLLAAGELLEGGSTGRGLDLPGGVRLEVEYGDLVFSAASRPVPAAQPQLWADRQVLEVPGLTQLEGTDWQVSSELLEVGALLPKGLPPAPGALEAFLDAAVVGSDPWVRRRRPGDRMRPLGAPGRKSLQDLFVDSKVPRRRRAAWPLVVGAAGIVWAVGLRIEHDARVTVATRRVLHLRFERYQA